MKLKSTEAQENGLVKSIGKANLMVWEFSNTKVLKILLEKAHAKKEFGRKFINSVLYNILQITIALFHSGWLDLINLK